mmetsp:Transcript_14440/g.30875  ORF Transcript_14440/g.30875 Transcript_14440/m.30875 type:complete len:147 (-) Transcript_14440:19-459(-)
MARVTLRRPISLALAGTGADGADGSDRTLIRPPFTEDIKLKLPRADCFCAVGSNGLEVCLDAKIREIHAKLPVRRVTETNAPSNRKPRTITILSAENSELWFFRFDDDDFRVFWAIMQTLLTNDEQLMTERKQRCCVEMRLREGVG